MIILVDTSVWVDYFRHGNAVLVGLIELDIVLTHPMVVGELACGTPPSPRLDTLNSLSLLQPCHEASLQEVRSFIEQHHLYGLGCGLIDLMLLVSTLITPGAQLWTLDKRLAGLAERFGSAYQLAPH